ncbi:hypothetical protein [Streptomyces phaeoluteigriseus]|uniref:hypothetical protein n=1 Tax=Streptomyces phaeoluteigriseus TaxID=114686 RepID=UPI00268B8EFF
MRAVGATLWTTGAVLPPSLPSWGAEDHVRLLAEPEGRPVDVARQARTAELLDAAHDHGGRGADAGLHVSRELA